MIRLPRFLQTFDVPGDPGPGGSTSAPSPAPAPTPTPTPAPAAGVPAPVFGSPAPSPTPAPPAPATPPPSQYTYEEDRSNWVPPDRFGTLEQQHRAAEDRSRRLQAMIEAGTGVRIPDAPRPIDPAVQEARQALETVYPGISQIYQAAPVLLQLAQTLQQNGIDPSQLGRLGEVFESNDLRWQSQARAVAADLTRELSQDRGGSDLTPGERQEVLGSFERWLRADQQRTQRYLGGDSSLTSEFLTHYRSYLGSFRRQADAQVAAAAARVQRLPGPPQQGAPPVPGNPNPNQPLTADDVVNSAWAGFSAGRRAG